MALKHGKADSKVYSVLKNGVDNSVVNSVLNSGSYSSVVQSILRCRICNKVYSDPILLPCLHTFCKACIAGLEHNDDGIKCPVCNMVLLLPADGIEGLPRNVYIARLTERFPSTQVRKPCSVCVLSGRTHRSLCQCLDCLDVLCKQCANDHRSSSLTVKHTVVSRDVLLRGQYDVHILEKQTTICYQHKEDVEIYCKSCRDLICIQCALTQHESHDIVAINDAADSSKQDLKNIIRESIMCLSVLKTRSDSLLSIQKTWKNVRKQKVKEVYKQIDDIISKIKKEGEAIVKQIQEHSPEQKHGYALIFSAIQSLVTSAKDTVSLCGHVIAHGSDVGVILLHDTLEGRMKTVDDVNKAIHVHTLDTYNLNLQVRTPDWKYFTLTDAVDPVTICDKLSLNESQPKHTQHGGSDTMPLSTGKELTKVVKGESLKLCELQLDQRSSKNTFKNTYGPEDVYQSLISGVSKEKEMILQMFKDNSVDVFLCVVLLLWLFLVSVSDKIFI